MQRTMVFMKRLGKCSLLWVLFWRKCGSRSFHFSGDYLLSKPYKHIVLPVEVYGGHVYLWHNVALSVCALLTKVFSGSCWDSEEDSMVVLIQSHGRQCHTDGCMSVRREGEVTSQHNRTLHWFLFLFFTMQLVCPSCRTGYGIRCTSQNSLILLNIQKWLIFLYQILMSKKVNTAIIIWHTRSKVAGSWL